MMQIKSTITKSLKEYTIKLPT